MAHYWPVEVARRRRSCLATNCPWKMLQREAQLSTPVLISKSATSTLAPKSLVQLGLEMRQITLDSNYLVRSVERHRRSCWVTKPVLTKLNSW